MLSVILINRLQRFIIITTIVLFVSLFVVVVFFFFVFFFIACVQSTPIKDKLFQQISKLATVVKGDQKAPFSIATTPRCRGGRYSFPWITPLYLHTYLILLSVKQGDIKYHF